MLGRIDHDPNVPRPNHQISRLWMSYSLEIRGSGVEIGRVYVAVGKTSVIIDCVYEMGTITLGTKVNAGVERGSNDRQAVVSGQWLRGYPTSIPTDFLADLMFLNLSLCCRWVRGEPRKSPPRSRVSREAPYLGIVMRR
jgi:hypothetical protein